MRIAGRPKERDVMALVVASHANKETAARFGIDQRMVENHHAAIGVRSPSDPVPLAIAAPGPSVVNEKR